MSARAWIARKDGQHSAQAKADRDEAKRRCRYCPEPWWDHCYGDTGKRSLTHRLAKHAKASEIQEDAQAGGNP